MHEQVILQTAWATNAIPITYRRFTFKTYDSLTLLKSLATVS